MRIKQVIYTELKKRLSYSEFISEHNSNTIEFICIDAELLDKLKSLVPKLHWEELLPEDANPGEHFSDEFKLPMKSIKTKVNEFEFIKLKDKFYQFCVDNGVVTCSY